MSRQLTLVSAFALVLIFGVAGGFDASATATDSATVTYVPGYQEAQVCLTGEPGSPYVVFDSIGMFIADGVTEGWQHTTSVPLNQGEYVAEVFFGDFPHLFSFEDPELDPSYDNN